MVIAGNAAEMTRNSSYLVELIKRCDVDPPDQIIYIQIALCNVFSLTAITGNALVLLAIFKYPQLHKPTNYFLSSLALGDMCVGLIMGPLWSARLILRVWPEDRTDWGQCVELFTILTLGTSTYSLCAVSVDRFLAIKFPFTYAEFMTKRRCLLAILAIWIFAISFGCCRLFFQDPLDLPNVWLIAGGVVVFIPFSVIGYCYYHIFKIARTQARQIANDIATHQGTKTSMKNRKASITVAVVIGIFVVCWTPAMMVGTLEAVYNHVDFCAKIRLRAPWVWIFLICMFNSTVNPWIYAIRFPQFRTAFKKIVCWWRKDWSMNLTEVVPSVAVEMRSQARLSVACPCVTQRRINADGQFPHPVFL